MGPFYQKKVPESGLSVLVVERTTCKWSQTGRQRHNDTRPNGGADPVWNGDFAAAGGCSGAGTQQHPGPGLPAGAAVHPGGPEDLGPLDPEALKLRTGPPESLPDGGGRTRCCRPLPGDHLSPGLGGKTGPLLTEINKQKLTVRRADKETFYRNCVKSIHQTGLSNNGL